MRKYLYSMMVAVIIVVLPVVSKVMARHIILARMWRYIFEPRMTATWLFMISIRPVM